MAEVKGYPLAENPPPQLEEFPIVSHTLVNQKLAGKMFAGMGGFLYVFSALLHYTFFSKLEFDLFNLVFPTIFVAEGTLMYTGYGRVMSKLKDSLSNLSGQGEFAGWQHWTARKFYRVPKEQVLGELKCYLSEHTSHVSQNPHYPHIYGKSMMRVVEANVRDARGGACLDLLVFSAFGSGSAKRCGNDLFARLNK